MPDPIISRSVPVDPAAAQEMAKLMEEEEMMIIESQQDLTDYNDTGLLSLFRNFRTLVEIRSASTHRTQGKTTDEKKVLSPEKIEEAANNSERRNSELKARTLLILRSSITDQDSPDEILNKTLRVYPDQSLADEALEFLLHTTEGDTLKAIEVARDKFIKTYDREIKAGRNISLQAQEFSKVGLGSPTSLRDLYRDITGTAREPLQLFEELTEKFRYDKLATVINFLLHSLGADLKAKGPSILRPELLRLLSDTRSLQGILGIFRFFESRMRLVKRLFNSYNLVMPPRLSFEVLARIFSKILAEKFLNSEKILTLLRVLGLADETEAQLIICSQFRDAVKQIALRYYRNIQHRDELLKTIVDTLDILEDEIEEEKEKKGDKE